MTFSTDKGDVVSSHGVVTAGEVGEGKSKGMIDTFLAELSLHRHWARDVSAVPV